MVRFRRDLWVKVVASSADATALNFRAKPHRAARLKAANLYYVDWTHNYHKKSPTPQLLALQRLLADSMAPLPGPLLSGRTMEFGWRMAALVLVF